MHYSLGNQNYVTGLKVIDLIFDKITARALGYKIDLKMVVAMLAHSVSANALYIAVSVIEELALAVNILVIHKITSQSLKNLPY